MEAEAYLNRLPMWANKKNSLKDIRIFLDQMGGPDRKIPAIHVAGTNGKGLCLRVYYLCIKKGRSAYRYFYFPSSGGDPGTFSYKRGTGREKCL